MDYGATVKPAEVKHTIVQSSDDALPCSVLRICTHCRTPVVAVATSRQDFELVWKNRAAYGYEEEEGCEASLWRAKDVVDGAHRCVCLSPPNSNAGMMITCAKIQTLRLCFVHTRIIVSFYVAHPGVAMQVQGSRVRARGRAQSAARGRVPFGSGRPARHQRRVNGSNEHGW